MFLYALINAVLKDCIYKAIRHEAKILKNIFSFIVEFSIKYLIYKYFIYTA
jgi:hypothetical protein